MKKTKYDYQNDNSKVSSSTLSDASNYDMVVFSHLRWGFVYQRPQHIISRMAKNYNILFIEEPIGYSPEEKNTANLIHVHANLTVLQPRVDSITEIPAAVLPYIKNKTVPIGWFYSAAFSPLLPDFKFDKLVFDCMDELSLFKGASAQIIAQEKYLMSEAHIVFTGGKSLYEAKKQAHNNVFCFPSSVEQDHFKQALNGIDVPADIANLPKPVIGYYGVIDERIDLELIHDVARQNPNASIVMIGPLAKISESDLPKEKNIFYPGMKTYDELPAYLKGFDIAMMPFALNDATKFISPTKTLEYMAAGKPIISTPIADVVRDYKECIAIVKNAEEFKTAINEVLQSGVKNYGPKYRTILESTSWDATVDTMNNLIQELKA